MSRDYPRKYVVVKDGQFKKVTVRNPTQETAVILKYAEALGLNRPAPFDNSRLVIRESESTRTDHHA